MLAKNHQEYLDYLIYLGNKRKFKKKKRKKRDIGEVCVWRYRGSPSHKSM